jgi:hypothetical protein
MGGRTYCKATMVKKSMENAKGQRDQGGRFSPGNNGGPGRPKGSLEKLSEAFLADFTINIGRCSAKKMPGRVSARTRQKALLHERYRTKCRQAQ